QHLGQVPFQVPFQVPLQVPPVALRTSVEPLRTFRILRIRPRPQANEAHRQEAKRNSNTSWTTSSSSSGSSATGVETSRSRRSSPSRQGPGPTGAISTEEPLQRWSEQVCPSVPATKSAKREANRSPPPADLEGSLRDWRKLMDGRHA